MVTRTRLMIGGLTLILAACLSGILVRPVHWLPQPGDTVELPQLTIVARSLGYPRQGITGGLSSSRDNRCVYLERIKAEAQSMESPPVTPVAWPRGYEGHIAANGDFTVLNPAGRVVAREGDLMWFGGRWSDATSDQPCLTRGRVFEVTWTPERAYFGL